MTYREFINDIRSQADYLEQVVKESQLIKLDDEMALDDTLLFDYEETVEEFIDNITGIHGHVIDVMR